MLMKMVFKLQFACVGVLLSNATYMNAQVSAKPAVETVASASSIGDFLKATPGTGAFGDRLQWEKSVDPQNDRKLVVQIRAKQDDGSWKPLGEYLGHSEDDKLYIRAKAMTMPVYYVIAKDAQAPPPPKKKQGFGFGVLQAAGGAVAAGGALMGRGGADAAKTGGAVSDVGTDGENVQAKGQQVGDAKDTLDRVNGSKALYDESIRSGGYTISTVPANDVPHNLSTADLLLKTTP